MNGNIWKVMLWVMIAIIMSVVVAGSAILLNEKHDKLLSAWDQVATLEVTVERLENELDTAQREVEHTKGKYESAKANKDRFETGLKLRDDELEGLRQIESELRLNNNELRAYGDELKAALDRCSKRADNFTCPGDGFRAYYLAIYHMCASSIERDHKMKGLAPDYPKIQGFCNDTVEKWLPHAPHLQGDKGFVMPGTVQAEGK